MHKLKFYKEDSEWYIDLPNWTGDKSELQMVQGADLLLEHLAGKRKTIILNLSEEKFDDSNSLNLIRESLTEGAYYILEKYENIEVCLPIWLCDVTKFVFEKFPKKIFFKINNN